MKQASLFACAVVGVVTVAGCTITTNDVTGTGRLEAHWTVAGTIDPAQCSAARAVNARIDVIDASGVKRNNDDTASCSAFAASFSESFASGTYTVQTTLVDGSGNAVTTTSSVTVVVPNDGTTASSTTDFPTSSFLAPTTGTGALEVDWTIDESPNATLCSSHNVASARVDVLDASSNKVNTSGDTQTCTSLATSFSQAFNAGAYTVQVTLLASDGTARTTTATAPVTIPGDGTTAKITVDFPETSFLTP